MSNITSPDSANAGKPKKKNWFLPIVIAIIIAIWTIWGALFFLAVAWVLRMDPGAEASYTVSDKEKKTARRVYTWLFWSPIITVPIFIVAVSSVSYKGTINEYALTALIPLIIHAFLLLGLTSKSRFVYRHTQQGILLIALRAGLASIVAVNIESNLEYAVMLFFLGNGALWLFGSLIGWSQISHGESWFMQRKGETPVTSDVVENLPAQKHIEQSQIFIHQYKSDEAKKHALVAFRSGDREIKAQAVRLLNTLDEVEKF